MRLYACVCVWKRELHTCVSFRQRLLCYVTMLPNRPPLLGLRIYRWVQRAKHITTHGFPGLKFDFEKLLPGAKAI